MLDKCTVVGMAGVARRPSQHATFWQVRAGKIRHLCSPPRRRRVFAAPPSAYQVLGAGRCRRKLVGLLWRRSRRGDRRWRRHHRNGRRCRSWQRRCRRRVGRWSQRRRATRPGCLTCHRPGRGRLTRSGESGSRHAGGGADGTRRRRASPRHRNTRRGLGGVNPATAHIAHRRLHLGWRKRRA